MAQYGPSINQPINPQIGRFGTQSPNRTLGNGNSPPPPPHPHNLPPPTRLSDRDRITTAAADFITLSQPRPDSERNLNEYIETPLKSPSGSEGAAKEGSTRSKRSSHEDNNNGTVVPVHIGLGRNQRLGDISRIRTQSSGASIGQNNSLNNLVPITTQPCVTFKKDKIASSSPSSEEGELVQHRESQSIICQDCGKCKCNSCRDPRHLPSKWLCDGKFLCSGDTILDYCSCMCCVKGIFYHCTKDYDLDSDVSCADKPCTCASNRRCLRWGCMGILSLLLPCLLCYWPMKGCLELCDICYNKLKRQGCTCRRPALSPDSQTHKRLLADLET